MAWQAGPVTPKLYAKAHWQASYGTASLNEPFIKKTIYEYTIKRPLMGHIINRLWFFNYH
jgi:uncharacterized phage-associated protein